MSRVGIGRRRPTIFPSLLERRRRVDQALFAVVMKAYLHGLVISDAHTSPKAAIAAVLSAPAGNDASALPA
jgi:transposase-like protein